MSTNHIISHTDSVPHFYPLTDPVFHLFQTALPHTVATNAFDRMTLLHLGDDCIREDLPSNGVEAGGGISETPLYSNEWIAYGRTRGFKRYNLRTKELKSNLICDDFQEVIAACRALDPSNDIFAFMIEHLEKGIKTRHFKIFNLSNESPHLLASYKDADYMYDDAGESFVVCDSTLFSINETEKTLMAFNSKLEPASHPFADAYNEHYKKLLTTRRITKHPYLPFAMIEGKISGIISWKDNEKDFIPFVHFEKGKSVSEFNFSQDGKYVAWMSETTEFESDEKAKYYAAKVNDKIPGYIGKPTLLGSTFGMYESNPQVITWASNPNTLVVSEMDGIYWWQIE